MHQLPEIKNFKIGLLEKITPALSNSIMLGIASISGLIFFATPSLSQIQTQAQNCGYYPNKSLYRNRTGNLVVGNDTRRNITVTLYHPDTGTAQTTTTVQPGRYISVPNSNSYIADDWGIQVNNGCVKYLGNITHYFVGANNIPFYLLVISDYSR